MCETHWLIQRSMPLNQKHWGNSSFRVKYALILWQWRLEADAQEVFI